MVTKDPISGISTSVPDEIVETMMAEYLRSCDDVGVALCCVALAGRLDGSVAIEAHRQELEQLGVIPDEIDADVRARVVLAGRFDDTWARRSLAAM
jgi:hypothetical protein